MKTVQIFLLPVTLAGLFFSFGSGPRPPPPPPTGEINLCVDNDSGSQSPALRAYRIYLKKRNHLTEALRFCEKPKEFREKIYQKLIEAQQDGAAPKAVRPAASNNLNEDQWYVRLTETEALDIYAARVAHVLWLEVSKRVPWSVNDFSEDEIDSILSPSAVFARYEPSRRRYEMHYVLDHSPREAYESARAILANLPDPKKSVEQLLTHLSLFRHGISGRDDRSVVTISKMMQEKISRNGCQSSTRYLRALSLSLNIPAKVISGYYAGTGHSTAVFSAFDRVLSHGDDPYTSYLKAAPRSRLMDTLRRWKTEVMNVPPGDPRGAHQSQKHGKKLAAEFPSPALITDYCRKGRRRHLETVFGDWLTDSEIDNLEERLIALANGC